MEAHDRHREVKSAEPGDTSRRSALAVIFGGLIAVVSGALGLVAGFVSNTWRQRQEHEWIRIGLAEDLDPQTFRKYVVHIERVHAWLRERRPLVIYIKDLYPDDPIALLSTCSHLGCSVDWKPEDEKFRCPCHGGVYNQQGEVIAGPPPRDLIRLGVKIEEEVFFVRLAAEGVETA